MIRWLGVHGWWVTILALVIGVVPALIIFKVLIRLPEYYFIRKEQDKDPAKRRPAMHLGLFALKNFAGVCILLAGAVMSLPLVPGPGLVAMLIGLSLVTFPGKRKLELRLLRAPLALDTINWLRAKRGRPALLLPGDQPSVS